MNELIEKLPKDFLKNPLFVSSSDIEGIDEDILSQLSISGSPNSLDSLIYNLIKEAGGNLHLDKIILGLYFILNKKFIRVNVVSRLYRMTKKGLIVSSKKRRGIYSIKH